ncbi:MAG: hypothetical protein WC655_16275 [Candidatus Hydrogenedentales bacterium]|jgi:hypothetical protein
MIDSGESWLDTAPRWFNRLAHSGMGIVSGGGIGTALLWYFGFDEVKVLSILLGFLTAAGVPYILCCVYLSFRRHWGEDVNLGR